MANNRMKLIALSFALIMVCSAIPGTESPISTTNIVTVDQMELSAEVWSDNFDDHDISDWTIYGINGTRPFDVVPGNFTAEDGVLRANGTELAWSIAARNSSVAYGTWTFDVDVVDNYKHEIVIPFIIIEWNLEIWARRAYFVQVVTGEYMGDPTPRLQGGTVIPTDSPGPLNYMIEWWESYPYDGEILGWKNIIITRESDGQFYVYINGTLALNHKDNRYTTCEEFHVGTNPGPALDNINVSNTVDYDKAPPEWEPEPTNQVIDLGQDFTYDLNASDFSGLGAWGLNDTTNFAIDTDGVITNAVDLALGVYGLNVSVSDTNGFTSSATFTLTVQSSEPPPVDYTLYLLLGGGGIVIIALVVLQMRKR
ncbi:MAG: hypothetical protein ACFFEE_06475 [Candidatus Thorarchaeota archaeon]